ncbi:Hpt domain-containing protein [Massilia sp. Root335]|uniref:hybrid sensor histidine kinase/response regulator n=1 Tax=Massilia sp. Root335 TaxID=1736517 RepID=UPI0006F22F81|nr:Hpt domain-containing protein [Massilia sp. Root335]KQV45673.1 chemotaxis protein [Massilia sp. Root335]
MTQLSHASAAPPFDTGPLSWVIGEIRDALGRSAKALQDASGRSPEAQPTLLLHAKSHLHQAHGALQMVDVAGALRLSEAAEQVIDRFKDGALALDDGRTAVVGEAYRALVEYLEELLDGAAPQPVRLFPYYRALQEMLGVERVHPGQMLVTDLAPALLPGGGAGPLPDYAATRAQFEKALLLFLRSPDDDARRAQAAAMRDALAGVVDGQPQAQAHAFWLALQAVADLVATGQVAPDLYVKQLFGQVNLQLRRQAQGHAELPDALLLDALFFIAAAPEPTPDARRLRDAYHVGGQVPPDYLERRYGRVDPEVLKDAKEALIETKQGWDRVATEGGEVEGGSFNDALSKLAGASEKLGAPALANLLRELGQAASESITGGRSDQFSLEMAEAMLFVEHGLDQVRQLPDDFGQHAEAVGQRLLALAHGETPPDAPAWHGEMARELQQGQTVAVLAGEIRTGLRQVEKHIDEYYEDPARVASLQQVDPLLHQLQGALAILDQDQATQAVDHVRARVRMLVDAQPDAATRGAVLDNLARNIGALGFFTDALAQNVDGARKRFRFDAAAGLFGELQYQGAAAAPEPAAAPLPAEPAPQPQQDAVEAELLEIFIGEARDVLDVVGAALPAAQANPADQDTLTRLRRGFHTLKGSSRMVGLERFAAAAAAIEKVMNLWLAEARAATPDLLALLAHAHAELAAWVDELAAGGSPRDGEALVRAAARVQDGGPLAPTDAPAPLVSAPYVPAADAPAELVPETVGALDAVAAAGLVDDDAALLSAAPEPIEPAAGFDVAPDEAPAPLPALSSAELPGNVLAFPVSEANVRHVGDLEIPLPLYNIYLGETEELVRTLADDFANWRAEPLRAVTPQAVTAAHTLGGTSATVGFNALRELAVALEEALQVAVPPLAGTQFDLLDETVERVRVMLQVFALGELAPAQPELLARLEALRDELGKARADAVFDGADPELAQRLDALFAATYASIVADPPLAGGPLALPASTELAPRPPAPRQEDPAVSAVDDLFDSYFDEPFAAPALESVPAPAQPDAGDVIDMDALFDVPEPEPQPEPEPEPEPQPEPLSATESDNVLAAEPVFVDELDPDLLPVFMEEAADLLPQIGNGLRQWQQNPADAAVAQGLLRALHTVKGSARMAGAMRLGQHTHALETQIENMLHAGTTNPAAFDELLANYDQAQLLFEQLQQPAAAPLDAAAAPTPAPVPAPSAEEQAARAPLVRVRADILDRLVNQAGEVSITRSKLETQVGALKDMLSDFADNLVNLRRQLREVEVQAESQIASRLSISGEREFDPLEFDRFTRLQELTRMMAESVNDVGSFHDGLARTVEAAADDLTAQSRLTRELQRDLMRVRMVPFASLSERLFRVARQTAKETDKRVNLDIRGGGVEIDRSVLERMAAPFEHLLRNAIVHGIEPRDVRVAAGKPETGELLVQVSQQGNEVEIRFADDGAGLDLARIRAKAAATGLLADGEEVADQDAAELVFEPGFSTADTLTELAGRGVGMDVVRSEARALGGRVDVETTQGRGAAFAIHLPLTLAVTQVVLVASGTRTHALPAVLVEQVLQVREADLQAAEDTGTIGVHGESIPLHYLPALLHEPGEAWEQRGGQRSSPVLVLRRGNTRIALRVDEVLGNREVVIKNIGPQLARMPGIAGATVLGSGEIVLILDPVQLAAQGVRPGRVSAAAAEPVPAPARIATIMVVDDSLTVRKVTQRLLEREGYRVLLAKDGVDALEQMQETRPDLMLVDIEMPRMDGFDLTRHVRGNEATASLPIIMITSRTADKHRNVALGLGVDAYFGKPFQEDALLAAITGLLEARAN